MRRTDALLALEMANDLEFYELAALDRPGFSRARGVGMTVIPCMKLKDVFGEERVDGYKEKKEKQRVWEVSAGVSVGYSEDMNPLENWEAHGMVCPYEHCIENSPLKRGELSCPLWGHNCPGGAKQVSTCFSEEAV